MRTLNLGILAHVDAGKTSLTERLLHAAGVIDDVGRVDDGNTRTDAMPLERQRGITIKSAVVAFSVDDITVNLIDTPGHPDFIAEVERVLGVLDGAVLVVSAVEGVQAQTRVLMRTLQRLRIPTLIFVNKIDRSGARHDEVLRQLAERLSPGMVSMGSTTLLGTRQAGFARHAATDAEFAELVTERLAEHDDALLAAFVEEAPGVAVVDAGLREQLVAQTHRALVHPVFFGSAITGAGVPELVAGIRELLPAREGDGDAPASGTVFKIERSPAGEKVAYVRLFAGTLRVREQVRLRGEVDAKVTAISVFDGGAIVVRSSVSAGQIAKVWGLADVRIGDVIGDAGAARASAPEHVFAPPSLETVVVPRRRADTGALYLALAQLAEQDPLIGLRRDDVRREISVSLYGEVQKEVVEATLAADFGLEVGFRETTTICVERLAGAGEALEVIDQEPNPFLATVGLRVEPGPDGSGVRFRLGIELGSLPLAFIRAIEETVHETLGQGLYGWEVGDCVVTLTRSGYWPRQSHAPAVFDKSMSSTAGDFRNLTPLVLTTALRQARTRVHEPVHRFGLELPVDTFAPVLSALRRLRAVAYAPTAQGASYLVDGEIPAARVHDLQRQLPTLTRGEGVLESEFLRYQPVTGEAPTRARTDHNPLDRKEYLLRVVRRV